MLRKFLSISYDELRMFHLKLQLVRLLLFIFPPYTVYRLRTWLLRLIGFSIGRGTAIMDVPTIVGDPGLYRRLMIGKNCYVGAGCYIDLAGRVILKDNAKIAPQTTILTGTHEFGSSTLRVGKQIDMDVEIGEGTWVAARCTILPGVKLGKGVVVAAGAVVTKSFPDNVLIGGVPAKIIRALEYEADNKSGSSAESNRAEPISLEENHHQYDHILSD